MPSKRSGQPAGTRFWLVGAGSAVVIVALVVVLVGWWRHPPQMGADDQVFRTVDALFTAVTSHDERLVSQCEQRLHASRDQGKLPPQAAAQLDRIIAQSRAGRWQPAAESLYAFMSVQRRDAATR